MRPWILLGLLLGTLRAHSATETVASAPRGVMLSIQDVGPALVSELRSVTLARGENMVRFRGLPARLDSASVSLGVVGGPTTLEVVEQYFQGPLRNLRDLLNRYNGLPAEVSAAGETSRGRLEAGDALEEGGIPVLLLRADDGSLRVYPNPGELTQIRWPNLSTAEAEEGSLVCRLNSSGDGPVNLRLWYTTGGFSWAPAYEILMAENGQEAAFLMRIALRNQSGADFEKARIQLVATTRDARAAMAKPTGSLSEEDLAALPMQYSYGAEVLQPESGSISATLDLPGVLVLKNGETRHLQLRSIEKLPVRFFYVYDGVRFDRFQRNRKTDWNYGTEFRREVERRMRFENIESTGLGLHLPPGVLRVYRRQPDGALEWLSESRLTTVPAGSTADLTLGPARGLHGERERTGYAEVVPLREYEESFEIRLFNDSPEEAEIQVREHLYRGAQFEIVKADADYTRIAPQTIEFRPVLKPGGKKTVHYTVHYRW